MQVLVDESVSHGKRGLCAKFNLPRTDDCEVGGRLTSANLAVVRGKGRGPCDVRGAWKPAGKHHEMRAVLSFLRGVGDSGQGDRSWADLATGVIPVPLLHVSEGPR